MLRDVVAGFLDTVTEREFDAPLLALLGARGFYDVHFLHGAFEFGKDFIAKGRKIPGGDLGSGDPGKWLEHQFALQSKAGDLGLQAWREVRTQLDEARLDGLAHPAFNTSLPRAAVLVVTGRLTGGAPVQAQAYREAELARGRPDLEIWDRETLLEWLVDAPEVGLAGTTDGPMLAAAGAIDSGSVSLPLLEQHARRWLPPVRDSLSAATAGGGEVVASRRRAAVEAAVLANRLRRNGRLDLAAYVALQLLRAEWCHALAVDPSVTDRPAGAVVATRLFAAIAAELLDQVQAVAGSPRDLLNATVRTPMAHAVYPATCARLLEILGLLGLLAAVADADEAQLMRLPDKAVIEETVATIVREQPGAAHPIGDSFAVGLLAPSVFLASGDPALARDFVRRTSLWVADRYDDEKAGIGLAPPGATAATEITQLLGGPYDNGPGRRTTSYLATVLTDLAAILIPDTSFYGDVLNEFLAVDIVPQLLRADELHAQWRPDGPGSRLTVRVEYRDPMPADRAVAAHFQEPRPRVPSWDAIALASVVRNRHSVVAVKDALEIASRCPATQPKNGDAKPAQH